MWILEPKLTTNDWSAVRQICDAYDTYGGLQFHEEAQRKNENTVSMTLGNIVRGTKD